MTPVDAGMIRNGRTIGPYRYTYAKPADVGPRQPLQLQFWIPKGRKGGQWVAHHAAPVGNYRAWRKVRRGHQHADRLTHSISAVRPCGYARSVADQIAAYMTWVYARGLTRVHRFSNCKYVPPKCGSLEVVSVDPAEFIGPAPAPELEPEPEACAYV